MQNQRPSGTAAKPMHATSYDFLDSLVVGLQFVVMQTRDYEMIDLRLFMDVQLR
jgi:hypothetical protein